MCLQYLDLMATDSDLIIPSQIPWEQMKGYALEELLFWLCDALGAQDLQWRAGSATGTSRDRGRDLEATFYMPDPAGALVPERWWVQAKGRTGTVEPEAVKQAVVDVQSQSSVGLLLVATNTRFSNDTRDWVAEFQSTHPRPTIRLWEHVDLERMLVQHPSVVARVAPAALSVTGKLAAAAATYWNRVELPSHGQLDEFWERRDGLEFSTNELIMLLVGEASRDGFRDRPWGPALGTDALAGCLVVLLANVPHLLARTELAGHQTEPIRAAAVHLIACALTRLAPDVVAGFVSDPWKYVEGGSDVDDETRAGVREHLIDPIIRRLASYFGTACLGDCDRVIGELEPDRETSSEARWFELLPSDVQRPTARDLGSSFVMETLEAPCRAGLPLGEERTCPFTTTVDEADVETFFDDFRVVAASRLRASQESAQAMVDRDTDASEDS